MPTSPSSPPCPLSVCLCVVCPCLQWPALHMQGDTDRAGLRVPVHGRVRQRLPEPHPPHRVSATASAIQYPQPPITRSVTPLPTPPSRGLNTSAFQSSTSSHHSLTVQVRGQLRQGGGRQGGEVLQLQGRRRVHEQGLPEQGVRQAPGTNYDEYDWPSLRTMCRRAAGSRGSSYEPRCGVTCGRGRP